MTHQIFIASYAKDFPWLRQCLRSLKKFCTDPRWLPPVIATTVGDAPGAQQVICQTFPSANLQVYAPRFGFENLAAQNAMMHADVAGTGDVMWLVGSDCIAVREFEIDPFMVGDKPRMLYNSYAAIGMVGSNWQRGVYASLGIYPEHEFMRRLPLPYPRAGFSRARQHVETLKKTDFEDWLFRYDNKPIFSESNLLGAYAYHYDRDLFVWELMDDPSNPFRGNNNGHPLPMVQFWSHGGFDRVVDGGAHYPGGTTQGKTPRQVITEVLGGVI